MSMLYNCQSYHIVGLIHASGTFILNAELQKNIHLVVSVKPHMDIDFLFHPSNSLEQSSWTIALCFLSSQWSRKPNQTATHGRDALQTFSLISEIKGCRAFVSSIKWVHIWFVKLGSLNEELDSSREIWWFQLMKIGE